MNKKELEIAVNGLKEKVIQMDKELVDARGYSAKIENNLRSTDTIIALCFVASIIAIIGFIWIAWFKTPDLSKVRINGQEIATKCFVTNAIPNTLNNESGGYYFIHNGNKISCEYIIEAPDKTVLVSYRETTITGQADDGQPYYDTVEKKEWIPKEELYRTLSVAEMSDILNQMRDPFADMQKAVFSESGNAKPFLIPDYCGISNIQVTYDGSVYIPLVYKDEGALKDNEIVLRNFLDLVYESKEEGKSGIRPPFQNIIPKNEK